MSSRAMFVSVLCGGLLVSGLVGCDKGKSSADKARQPATVAAPGPAQPSPAGVPSPHAGVTAPSPTAAPGALAGTVAETMDAGGYTYARVTTASGDVWAAGPQTQLALGTPVDVSGGTLMSDFRSDTLNRTFERIYFLSAWGGAPAAANPHAMGGATAPAPGLAAGEIIEPQDGSQPIAQIYADKASLAGKPVAVRGKVVKFNGGIMGKNWVHLQDGSASGATGDLIVTTLAEVELGQVVIARGTLVLDKDLGSGYRYDVLVEDAALTAQ